jgi:putative PEP-CTERM system TPR-repeat lipoprotein
MKPSSLRVQLAFAYFRGGQVDKAQQALEYLPSMSGQRSEFQSDALPVLAQMAQGNQTEALERAKALREKWPGRAEAHIVVGSIEMAVGDLEAARLSFDQGLEIEPDNIHIIRYLAQLDVAEDKQRAAQDRYLVILELEPDDTSAMVSLARLAADSEDHDTARNWLEKARETDPKLVGARSLLAAWYLASRDYAAAEKVAKEAVKIKPDSAELQNTLGLAQYYGKNYREAIFALGKAAELAPNEPSYRFNLARAQAARGDNASAAVSLSDSMDQSLEHLPSGALLAAIRADLGDMDGAQDIARRLRELHPNDAAPYVLEAELLVRKGDLPGAAEAYDKALDMEITDRYAIRAYQVRNQLGTADQVEPLNKFLEIRPLDSAMRVYLAQAYMNIDEIGNANTQYERVLELEPDNFIAVNNLAWNYFTNGDARAEQFARRAYELRPENDSVIDTLGWILVQKGDFEKGIPLLRTAVELGDNRPDVRFHLAAALAESGEKDEARLILEDLLESAGSFSNRDAAESLLIGL